MEWEIEMVRQNGRITVHFDTGLGPVCGVGGSAESTTDSTAVYCGLCARTPAFKDAYRATHRQEGS